MFLKFDYLLQDIELIFFNSFFEIFLHLPFFLILILFILSVKTNKNKKLKLILIFYFYLFIFWVLLFIYFLYNYLFFLELKCKISNFFLIGGFFFTYKIDLISLILVILTSILTIFIVLYSLNQNIKYFDLIVFVILLLYYLIINCFLISEILWFYFFFEATLVPTFLLIILWGTRFRKIHASFQMYFYTLCFSIPFLIVVLNLNNFYGIDFPLLIQLFFDFCISYFYLFFLFISFLLAFNSKIPIFPLHIWLPEAHVEASTVGSVYLAAILLKLGLYGILFILFPLYKLNEYSLSLDFLFFLSILGVITSSWIAIRQIDIKKIVAYSSITHLNFSFACICVGNSLAISGAVLNMIIHGVTSAALFLLVGFLYKLSKSKTIWYFGGIFTFMPFFSFFFIFFMLSNISFPGTFNFISEFISIVGLIKYDLIFTLIISLGLLVTTFFCFWATNRILFGPLKDVRGFTDFNKYEVYVFFPLFLLILIPGVHLGLILNFFELNMIFF